MPHFINIAAQGNNPVHINVEDIAAVYENFDTHAGANAKKSIRLTDRRGRELAWLQSDSWGLDTDDVVAKIAATGVDLFPLSMGWPGNNDDIVQRGRYFVNPAAFESIITSKPVAKDGGEEKSAILLSLKGAYIESYGVPVKDIDALMVRVTQAVPNVRYINTAQVTARFYDIGRIAYDPEAIITIYPNGDQVNVRFSTGNVIDFNVGRRDWGNFYLDKKYNNATPEKREAFDQNIWNNPNMNMNTRLQKFKTGIRKRLCREFARAVVSSGTEGLIRVHHDGGPLYSRFNNLSMMSLYSDKNDGSTQLSFQFTKGSPEDSGFGGGNCAWFKDRAKAESELQRLTGVLAAPKP